MTDTDDDDLDQTIRVDRAASAPRPPPQALLVCLDPAAIDPAAIDDVEPEQDIELVFGEVTVGRVSGNSAVVRAEGISRNHARFLPSPEGWRVEDLGSANGVLVNGKAITEATLLHEADELLLGAVRYRFEPVAAEPDTPAQPEPALTDDADDKTMMLKPSQRARAARASATGSAATAPPAAPPTPGEEPAPASAAPVAAEPPPRRKQLIGTLVTAVLIAVIVFILFT